MEGNQAEWALVYCTIALICVTFFLFIVAVFQEKIKNYFFKPELDCQLLLNTNEPDCHLLHSVKVYYFRFRIINNGKISAKNVEVILKDLRKKEGKILLSQDNLLWSTLDKKASKSGEAASFEERMYWNYISPDTYQYCNLCSIKAPKDENESSIVFSVYWPTVDYLHILPPDTYYFDIIIGAENVIKSKRKKYKLEYNGKWTEDEDEMFKENIFIKEI